MTFEKFFGHDIDFSKSAQMWTIHHLILSLVALFSIIVTLKVSTKIKASTKELKLKHFLIGWLIVLELSYHIHNWTYPRFSVPLHLCSFAVFFIIALLITDSKKVWDYAFIFGTIGGIMALLIPNSLGYTYYNFRYYHFILLHATILSVPLYYYKAYHYRLDYQTTMTVYKHTFILGIVVYILNGFFNTNYWFISEIPDNVSSTFTNWNVYIVCFIALTFITVNTLYFVSNFDTIFKAKQAKRKAKKITKSEL